MPIYEYRCRKCQCAFETLVLSARDASEVSCPKCHEKEVERLLSCFTAGSGLGSAQETSCNTRSQGFS
jgi:putative FmdB family regulatory protein